MNGVNVKPAIVRKSVFALFGIIALVIIVAACCTVVDTSEVGIKFKKFSLTEQGKLDAVPVTGWVFYNPVSTSVYTYPVYVQRVDYAPFQVTTKDAAVFSMDPLLAFRMNRDKAVDVFAKYRKPLEDIEQGYMRTVIYDAYRIVANRYTSDELMASRAQFEAEVRLMLETSLNDEGFEVEEFTSQITPPVSLSQAIEAKNQAIQEALKAENLVKQAEANAKIAIAKAEGEAKALRIKADGEAYYNRTVAASLNALLVQQDAIQKWDGKLPEYMGGHNIPMINLK
ncbi:MAG: prohibitin family protein [Paludibacter sp.]|nr:prohibitin family protein [Bacteroidales bacterium]MCM1068784.1 prohibitin family protein [Prevotella sp.]MCM1353925.1 prohibitin family protein [Bacteroides sp.]MCM1443323.1 prohibitin family protein [Muribaculum sp.]MCM1482136.1 prohibitin family protein [Paludibacter sp.]